MKGSSMALAIIAFALGYLFKVPLESLMSRAVSGFVLIVLGFWYVCVFLGLRTYHSIVNSIESTSAKLGYSFERHNYSFFKTVIISSMIAAAFIVAIFAYLWIDPPAVSQTPP
jgi:hypothetical protein